MRGGAAAPPRFLTMIETLCILMTCLIQVPAVAMRRVAQIPSGPCATGRVVCCDSDHDSLPELIFSFSGANSWNPFRVEFWESQGWNRFRLVYADTGTLPGQYPGGITAGNSVPWAAGDLDGDGLTDLVCTNYFYDPETSFDVVMTLESPDRHSYPSVLSWYYGSLGYASGSGLPAHIAPDLDHDGRNEIIGWLYGLGKCIWENIGNDSNVLVWNSDSICLGGTALGDFGGNGRWEFAVSEPVEVWECTSEDQYEMVYREEPYPPGWGPDVFMTNDIDGDGRSEFYVGYFNYSLRRMYLCMYEDEIDGSSHQFNRTMVDSLTWFGGDDDGRASTGGDVDGDGVDECIWTTYDSVRVYKAFGNNDLRKVWEWARDSGSNIHAFISEVYDVNNDGYNELLLSVGHETGQVLVYEVDAVDLISPNSGTHNVGDTVTIRVATHVPPRCDSLSLFLRCDSLWRLDTIATGLPANTDRYRWVVPSSVPDTGRIVVMAYGPGHQWDMSDSVITFIGGGVAEGTHSVPLQWSLSVSPNPARGPFSVRYDVARQSHVSVGVYDAGGRLVRSLSDAEVSPGRYEARIPSGVLPAGIYFLRLDTPGFRDVKKAVVAR
jgi:hypothetical protein